ncbi:MAG: DivIVA domain-containing protein [Syntrophomonadaceae bacterium]
MNRKVKIYYYAAPLLLGVFMFGSNFLNTKLFAFGDLNFSVWFVLSVFSFACGWLIDKTMNWKVGGKVVFAVIVATTITSVLMISFFREYFASNELITENLILYSLRNVVLGCMGFFGMSVAELFVLQKEVVSLNNRIDAYESMVANARKEADLKLKEAQLNAQVIVREAEMEARQHQEKKARIEKDLKEFIQVERELIRKYEENE